MELLLLKFFINGLENKTKWSCIMFADDIRLGGLVYTGGLAFHSEGCWKDRKVG